MAAGNNVTLIGNLTRDPELRYTASNMAVRNGEWEEQVSFFNFVAWGELGENCAASLTKGSRAIVTGRLEQRSWETAEGDKRSVVEVVADEIGPSLRWAQAQIERTERSDGTQQQSYGAPALPDEESF